MPHCVENVLHGRAVLGGEESIYGKKECSQILKVFSANLNPSAFGLHDVIGFLTINFLRRMSMRLRFLFDDVKVSRLEVHWSGSNIANPFYIPPLLVNNAHHGSCDRY